MTAKSTKEPAASTPVEENGDEWSDEDSESESEDE